MPSSTDNIFTFNNRRFAVELISFRSQKRLSRRKYAELINTSKHIINEVENRGVRPSVEVVFNFCEIAGKNIREFFD